LNLFYFRSDRGCICIRRC